MPCRSSIWPPCLPIIHSQPRPGPHVAPWDPGNEKSLSSLQPSCPQWAAVHFAEDRRTDSKEHLLGSAQGTAEKLTVLATCKDRGHAFRALDSRPAGDLVTPSPATESSLVHSTLVTSSSTAIRKPKVLRTAQVCK